MAYITKDEVKAKSIKLKELNKRFGISARFSGSNSSTLTLNITKGSIDFIKNHYLNALETHPANTIDDVSHLQVSPWHLTDRFSASALEYLKAAFDIMQEGWFDKSDITTDYFHTAWYNYICIGKWNKPYNLV